VRAQTSRNHRAPPEAAKDGSGASWDDDATPVRRAESSGVFDLAALMAGQPNGLEGALARVKASGRASHVFDEGAALTLAPVDWSVWAAHAASAKEAPPQRPRRVWPIFFDLTVAALLLGCALMPRGYRAALAARLAKPAPVTAPAVLVSPAPPATPSPVAPAAPPTPAPTPPASIAAVGPSAAPAASPQEDVTPPRRQRSSGRASAAVAKGTRTRGSRAPSAARPAVAARPPPTPVASAAPASLSSALREAAGAPAATEPAAEATSAPPARVAAAPTGPDTRPERPSGSAVANAITRVLPAARACLGDVPDASRAIISFGPDGAVQKVDVTGPAAASPKQAPCIRTALGRAHVPPFSQDSYTAAVTVRPP
jgi:hypothetical protein